MLPFRLRKSLAISIPIFSAAAFFGFIENIFGLGIKENIASTSITLSIIFGGLNLVLLYLIVKHQVP